MKASMQNRQDHFAYCVQLFGGTTAFSRRLGIDERAVRRFINGEKPISDGLIEDNRKGLARAERPRLQRRQIRSLRNRHRPAFPPPIAGSRRCASVQRPNSPRVRRKSQQKAAGFLEGEESLAVDDDRFGAAVEYPAQQTPL